MKRESFLCVLVCFGIIYLSITFYTHLFIVNNEVHRSFFYYSRKINQNGEYKPYYGYTVIAMIDPALAKEAKKIEDFIRTSELSKSYTALPATSYHMTIYSIYQCGDKMIPPVARWINATGETISNQSFLPDAVFHEQHANAICILEKYLSEPLHIKYASLFIGKRTIKLKLEADDESMQRIRNARNELIKIYEDPNASMEPINEKLHIGLGYIYAPMEEANVHEWNQLNELIRPFNGAKLLLPAIYLFDSMENYFPYDTTNAIKCSISYELRDENRKW